MKPISENRKDLHTDYGDNSLSNGAISKLMNRFKDGRETIKYDNHTGRQKRRFPSLLVK